MEAERRARYKAKFAKAKDSCTPIFAIALVLYPALVGFLLLAKTGAFSLLIPTPTVPGSPPSLSGLHGSSDLWETGNRGGIVRTAGAFFSVAAVHLFIVFQILMRGPPGSGYMKPQYACIAPAVLFLVTISFYVNYVSMARYNAYAAEWWVMGAFCVLIFGVSVAFIAIPWRVTEVQQQDAEPAAAEAALAANA